MFYDYPILFEKNYVRRIYTGGTHIRKVDKPDFYPEHWLASSVHALNEPSSGEYEGISKFRSEPYIYFSDALKEYPRELLGDLTELPVLTKIIDSAIRLPVQAHPDKAFSKLYFNSSHGKEEAWYILDVNPGARIYYGFKEGVTREDLSDAIDSSERSSEAMTGLVDSFIPSPGDIVYIPAKMVHAIGAGVTLIEVQEPTDFTIQPERMCGSYRLTDSEMYLGLTKEQALDCFDMTKRYPAPLKPRLISHKFSVNYYELIGKEQTVLFSMRLVESADGEYKLDIPVAVYYVADGEGDANGVKISSGDCFFMPFAAVGKTKICGTFRMIECF